MDLGRFDAVLFDVGGTLWTGDGSRRVQLAAERLGASVEPARAERLWKEIALASRSPDELAKCRDLTPERHRRCWLDLLAPADEIAAGMSEILYEQEFQPGSFTLYADTRPTLQWLRDIGVRMGVVSDVGHDIRGHLTHHDLLDYFGACVLSFEHGAVKPDPRLFLSAGEQLGVAPGRTLMVGDTPETDGGAIAAGMTALILPSAPAGTVRGLAACLALVTSAAQSA